MMATWFGLICLLLRACSMGVRVATSLAGSRTRLRPPISLSSHALTNSFVSEEDTFPIPIFPLRKQARLPGDTLTLNLYEDRYLSMAERILASEHKLFGAMYCSNKPQIMKAGEGPIVPLVSPGDVGVICKVIFDEESMVETPTIGFRRRRIRLDAMAVGRFSVERLLHNGFDKKESDHPYILATVQRIDDVPPTPSGTSAVEQLEQTLVTLINKIRNENEASLKRNLFAPGYHEAMVGKTRTLSEEAYFDWMSSRDGVLTEAQRQQMLSFAAAATLERKLPGNDLEWMLLSRSTTDRLNFVLEAFQDEQKLGPIKKLFEMLSGNKSLDEAS